MDLPATDASPQPAPKPDEVRPAPKKPDESVPKKPDKDDEKDVFEK